MPAEITNEAQTIGVAGVEDVVLTPVVSDGAGGYVRELRVFGEAVGSGSKPQVFVVRLKSATAAKLEVDLDRIKY